MRHFCGLLLLLCSVDAAAQQPWTVGAGGGYGFLWPHSKSSWILVEGHAPAVELFAERRVSGKQSWHHDHGLPTYGFSALYTTFANPGRIGGTVRVVPYFVFPFTRGAHFSFGMRIGWGVGYVARPYERTENGKQVAIGSRLNTAILIQPQLRYQHGRSRLTFGVGIDHWSNGSYKLPNLGLNYLAMYFGVARTFGEEAAPQSPSAPPVFRRWRYQVVGAFGRNETGTPLSGQSNTYTLNGEVRYAVSYKSSFSAGVDLFNKGTMRVLYPELADKDRMALTQAGLKMGYAFAFGSAELFFNIGAYVHSPGPDQAPFYHRTGFRYQSGKHLVWSMALKSHYAVADHWEFGVGYRW